MIGPRRRLAKCPSQTCELVRKDFIGKCCPLKVPSCILKEIAEKKDFSANVVTAVILTAAVLFTFSCWRGVRKRSKKIKKD
jgi:hypothetical protein